MTEEEFSKLPKGIANVLLRAGYTSKSFDAKEAISGKGSHAQTSVAMSSLGHNGRFGNQLFQFLYLYRVAMAQNAVVQTPPWLGNKVFGLDRHDIKGSHAKAIEGQFDSVALFKPQPKFKSTDFQGYFQLHTKNYTDQKSKIQELFQFVDPYREVAKTAFANVSGGKKVIAVHLRRGDYGYGLFYTAPCKWYEEWAKQFDPAKYVIYVCSDEPKNYLNRFKGFKVKIAKKHTDELNMIIDFYVMTKAEKVAISNSSFSFFASMLNQTADQFVRPEAKTMGLVAFDPWNSEVLQRQELSASKHKELMLND
jgi:hypothetical protein